MKASKLQVSEWMTPEVAMGCEETLAKDHSSNDDLS